MKLKLLALLLLASTAFSASAADQTFSITPDVALNFDGLAPFLSGSGGGDTLTFTGAPAGMYEAILSYSSVNVKINSASLNGDAPVVFLAGNKASLGTFDIISSAPFTLKLWGTVTGDPASAAYSGQLTITPVPEPATYGMLLGGLGLLAFAVRRKA
ncbi:MAG: FxDxF family PEP-CTERM protein [Burkholderiaceae bacterium]|nr:FxDxF family PEP-CTERM protein [Burkholderiaceae bacterium]